MPEHHPPPPTSHHLALPGEVRTGYKSGSLGKRCLWAGEANAAVKTFTLPVPHTKLQDDFLGTCKNVARGPSFERLS